MWELAHRNYDARSSSAFKIIIIFLAYSLDTQNTSKIIYRTINVYPFFYKKHCKMFFRLSLSLSPLRIACAAFRCPDLWISFLLKD